jgi:hypothetical protein
MSFQMWGAPQKNFVWWDLGSVKALGKSTAVDKFTEKPRPVSSAKPSKSSESLVLQIIRGVRD